MRFVKSRPLVAMLALVGCVALGAGTAWAINYFIISPFFYFTAGGGDLSSYQVGFFDPQAGDSHVVLVNPTPNKLEAFVVFFNNKSEPIGCDREFLRPNDLDEVDIADALRTCGHELEPLVDGLEKDRPHPGVIKVVTFQRPANLYYEAVQAGVVGWVQKKPPVAIWVDGIDEDGMAWAPGMSGNTPLRSVPVELLVANNYYELNLIVDYVNAHCPAKVE